MQKSYILTGITLAALAVVLGAFGAHGLKARLTLEQLGTFETGVRYQFYHAFALMVAGLLSPYCSPKLLPFAGYAFLLGVLFFSGSIYLLACRDLLGIAHWRWLGPITPIGGMSFIIGWALLFAAVVKGE